MVFEDDVCLLESDLLWPGTDFCRYQLLEIPNLVSGTTLYRLLFPHPVVYYHFDQNWGVWVVHQLTLFNQVHHTHLFNNREIHRSLLWNYTKNTFGIPAFETGSCFKTEWLLLAPSTTYVSLLLWHLLNLLFVLTKWNQLLIWMFLIFLLSLLWLLLFVFFVFFFLLLFVLFVFLFFLFLLDLFVLSLIWVWVWAHFIQTKIIKLVRLKEID